MVKNIIFLIFLFYFLILIQTSFLVHFNFSVLFFNSVFIVFILINLLKISWPEKIASAVIGGIFLDIFSLSSPFGFFGFYLFILLLISFLLKFISEKYVRISFYEKR